MHLKLQHIKGFKKETLAVMLEFYAPHKGQSGFQQALVAAEAHK